MLFSAGIAISEEFHTLLNYIIKTQIQSSQSLAISILLSNSKVSKDVFMLSSCFGEFFGKGCSN